MRAGRETCRSNASVRVVNPNPEPDEPTTSPPLIHVRDLRKVFQRPEEPEGRFKAVRRLFICRKVEKVAVHDVSFDIAAGELVGYLGANGAGKSTTIKMLTGILVPTSGVVEVAGRVPWQDRRANAAHIGAVFGQRSQLWYDLPLRDSFELIRDLYGIADADYRQRLGMFTELLDMADFLDSPVRFLSLGQRMRGDLVAALLHSPEVVFLDEEAEPQSVGDRARAPTTWTTWRRCVGASS